jgi:hypothetical protein
VTRAALRLMPGVGQAYQPFILADEASLLDAVATAPDVIAKRLVDYFGVDLSLDLRLPVWQLVDQIRRLRPSWPDDPGAPC